LAKVDRRILKTQEALKKAVIELMSEKIYLHYLDKFDLLDNLIEEHIDVLRELCRAASELEFTESNLIWTEYFERNYSFFSMMLASKGAPYFRGRFLDFLIEEYSNEVDVTKGKNEGLNEDLLVRFVASAFVGVVEWWFTNEKPVPHHVLAEQLGTLLEKMCNRYVAQAPMGT
jgi:AcrR family transcriptional regulator